MVLVHYINHHVESPFYTEQKEAQKQLLITFSFNHNCCLVIVKTEFKCHILKLLKK